MKTLLTILTLAFATAVIVPAASITTATTAEAKAKSKKCHDWCTNKRTGRKFRIR